MSNPLRQNLLGYLLGAVEHDERTQVEQQIQNDAALRRELETLRSALHPLAADANHAAPPPGLAQRCCEYVYSRTEIVPAALSPVSGSAASAPTGRRWSRLDLAVAGAIAVAVAVLIVPAVFQSNVQAKLIACQDNLKNIGLSMAKYSDLHGGSYYPAPQEGDRINVVGKWAPTLVSQGYLQPAHVICPASSLADDPQFRVPTLEQLNAMNPAELAEILPKLTAYGFTLGHREGGNGPYQLPRNQNRKNFALMGDSPSDGPTTSRIHGGTGQNVLFEGGHVKHVNSAQVGNDDIFKNDHQKVAPGVHNQDSVIVPGHTPDSDR